MKRTLAVLGSAAALALLAPVGAQAQTDPGNYTFECLSGTCETQGNSFQGPNGIVYRYVIEVGQGGEYSFDATGTSGDTFWFYYKSVLDENPWNGTLIGSYTRGPNPIAPVGTVTLAAGTYYISAVAECTDDSAACRTTLLPEGYDPGTVPDTTVPEPATMLLLGSGLAGVLGARRRRKTQS